METQDSTDTKEARSLHGLVGEPEAGQCWTKKAMQQQIEHLEKRVERLLECNQALNGKLALARVTMETERDALRFELDAANEKLLAIAEPAVSGVLARMAKRTEYEVIEAMRKNLAVLDRVKSERDALRELTERCREVVAEFVVHNPKFRSRPNGEMQDPMGAHELLADLVSESDLERAAGVARKTSRRHSKNTTCGSATTPHERADSL